MSRKRKKQRKNKKMAKEQARLELILETESRRNGYECKVQAPKHYVIGGNGKKDVTGTSDLTGYNAIKRMNNPDWTIVLK